MIVLAGISFGLLVLVLIVSLLLRRQLREKYATLWIIIGLVILVLAAFPGLLIGLSQALGVAVPSNLIFVLALTLLVGVTLHLSWELSRAEDEVRRVAEDVAIVRADVEELRRLARPDTAIGGPAASRGVAESADSERRTVDED